MADSFYKTKKGLITRIYNNQISHSKSRGHRGPEYSKESLIEWCLSQEKFNSLFEEYKQSDYERSLAPSVNRKDNDVHYCINNIELMAWCENDALGKDDRISGKDGVGKSIFQLKDGILIAEYPTISSAKRSLGKKRATAISNCLNGRVKTAYGFVWQYKDESQEV